MVESGLGGVVPDACMHSSAIVFDCSIERLVRTTAANRKYLKGYNISFSSCRKVPRHSTVMEPFPAVDLQTRVGVTYRTFSAGY